MSLPAGYSFDFKTELVSKTFHVSIFSVFGHMYIRLVLSFRFSYEKQKSLLRLEILSMLTRQQEKYH